MRDKAALIQEKFFKLIRGSNYCYDLKFNNTTYKIDLHEQTCSCRRYIKDKLCCHLFKANQLFENSTEFVYLPKRGAPNKKKKQKK